MYKLSLNPDMPDSVLGDLRRLNNAYANEYLNRRPKKLIAVIFCAIS